MRDAQADPAPHGPFAELTLTGLVLRAVVDRAHARRLCDGHFPGDPLLPGAYLAELMADLAARLAHVPPHPTPLPAEVVRCVFLAPVRPEDRIEVRAWLEDEPATGGVVDAEVWAAGACGARARFRFGGQA